MTLKIIEDIKNPLLKRREIKVVIESGKNPSMQEASKVIAHEFKTKEENMVIKKIQGKFGRNTFLISAKIYDSEELKNEIEPKLNKNQKKAKKEEVEAKPSDVSAEEKQEEKKEKPTEVPAEEKPKEESE